MKISLHITLFAAISVILTGCKSAESGNDTLATPDRAAVSSIPWNKPASWEGTGALGGFMPQGGH